jgi:hypothetical protein
LTPSAIWRENMGKIAPNQADLLVRGVNSGRKIIILGGGHAPCLSDPATFHAEPQQFLGELT